MSVLRNQFIKPYVGCAGVGVNAIFTHDSDKSCLAIGRIKGVGMQISKLYYGDEADKIYRILTEVEAITAWNKRE